MEPLPSRRLVLSLYKSLLKVAAKYDKNIPCGKNPLFLMQRDKDAKAPDLQSVLGLVREPFRTHKDLNNNVKITARIQDAFNHLRILHQFYQPSMAWISILSRKNIPFEEVVLTICKFENGENKDVGVQLLNAIKQRVQTYLTKVEESKGAARENAAQADAGASQVSAEVEGEIQRAQAAIRNLIGSLDEGEKASEQRLQEGHAYARKVMDAIARVMYKDMGFREYVGKIDEFQMSKALRGGPVPHSMLASTIIALAQCENVQLYAVNFSPGAKSLLRYSYLQDPVVCHESDLFMDPASGEILPGLRAVKQLMDKSSNKSTNSREGMLLVEHRNNSTFVLQVAAALAANNPSQWKEHLTVIEELKKRPEPEPTQLFQFSDKSKSTKTKKDTPSSSPAINLSLPTPPEITPSSSPSPSSSTPPSPPSSPSPTTTSPSTFMNPTKYFSSFFSSLFSRRKPTTARPTALASNAPPSPSSATQKEGEIEEKGEKEKKKEGRKSAPPLPNHLRKYSRMWGSDLPYHSKTRRF